MVYDETPTCDAAAPTRMRNIGPNLSEVPRIKTFTVHDFGGFVSILLESCQMFLSEANHLTMS